MKATLYLHTDAVRYSGADTDGYVNNFKDLIRDLRDIVYCDADNNRIVVSEDLFVGEICANATIYDFIEKNLDKDETDFIYGILYNTSEQVELTFDELKEKMKYNPEETECCSLVVLNEPETETTKNPYMTFDDYQIVYGRDSWYRLRRQILANHPGDAGSFIDDCRRYFPNLTFSEDCEGRLRQEYLQGIPRKIVYYLSCMNDCLSDFRDKHPTPDSINLLLADFAGVYGMDEAGSMQRTPGKKSAYTFDFLRFDGTSTKSVCCDPHFKIKTYDSNSSTLLRADGEKCYGRIYFNFRDSDVHPQNILIGSIGPHV